MDYQFDGYRAGNLVKLEVMIEGEPVDALATIVHKDEAYHKGQRLVTKLRKVIPGNYLMWPFRLVRMARSFQGQM